MSDDLISREDAIKAVSKVDDYGDGIGFEVRSHCLVELEMLPSAQPKQGEWIFKTVFPNDKSEFPMGYLVCSVCGSYHSNSTPCNYCDNCGARMTERSE